MTNAAFRKLALSFEASVELPHFEKTSFRVAGKIFATLDTAAARACLKFSEEEQALFCSYNKAVIFPVPNKWGKQGWTLVELKKISAPLLKEALKASYCCVAPKKLAAQYQRK